MRPAKLLLAVYSLEPGGAERVAYLLAKHLDRSRFAPAVLSMRDGRLRESFESLGVPVHVLSKASGIDFAALSKLFRLFRKERIDILHSHSFSANLWTRLVGRLTGVPAIVVTEHTLASNRRALLRLIDRALCAWTDRIVAVCAAVRQSFIALERIPAWKIVTILNGIEPEAPVVADPAADRRRLAGELGFDPEDLLIVAVGRLEPPKGHGRLLRAAPRILEACPRSRLLLVGDGFMRRELETLAARLGIADRTVFAGYRPDARSIVAAADVYVVPSSREGLSMALLEAMALARPIVATDVGGNPEAVVHGESGLIVPADESPALEEAIVRLLRDPALRRKLGEQAGRRFAECFTATSMVAETERLYASLARRAPRRGGEPSA